MKKLLLVLTTSVACVAMFSQQLPNNGFETWIPSSNSTERPDQWRHLNETLPASLALFVPNTWTKVSPGYNGSSYCVKLKTVNSAGMPVNGILTTGTIDYQNQTVTGGLAYTLKPDSLTGYYKYTPSGADKGTIEIVLKDANNIDTIAQAKFYTPNSTVSAWTRFSAPLVYWNSTTPSFEVSLISSSNGTSAVVNSEIWVDDLTLIFNPVGIKEVNKNGIFKVYSGGKNIFVELKEKTDRTKIEIFNLAGQSVYSGNISEQSSKIFIPQLSSGIYVYMISNGVAAQNGKLIVE